MKIEYKASWDVNNNPLSKYFTAELKDYQGIKFVLGDADLDRKFTITLDQATSLALRDAISRLLPGK